MEILLSKCGNPILKRSVRSRIYNEHGVKYEFFYLLLYNAKYDVERIRDCVRRLPYKWINIRNRYLVNVSDINVKLEDLYEIENYYLQRDEMERAILELDKDESCNIINTLVEIVVGE